MIERGTHATTTIKRPLVSIRGYSQGGTTPRCHSSCACLNCRLSSSTTTRARDTTSSAAATAASTATTKARARQRALACVARVPRSSLSTSRRRRRGCGARIRRGGRQVSSAGLPKQRDSTLDRYSSLALALVHTATLSAIRQPACRATARPLAHHQDTSRRRRINATTARHADHTPTEARLRTRSGHRCTEG